ncbi:MAG: phosphatase PAP2 family protein [Acidimicrobiia bacterium]
MRDRLIVVFHAARRLPITTVVAIGAALATAGAAVLVLAAMAEDVAGHDGATRVDGARLGWIARHRTPTLVQISRALDNIGAVGVVLALAAALGALLWWKRKPLAVALAPVLAVSIAGAVGGVLKIVFDRGRPPASIRLMAETDPSFPSGHATAAMALGVSAALVVALFVLRRPLARAIVLVAGVVIPLGVAGSRLELGVHWPTDVVAGLALGFGSALAIVGLVVAVVELGGRGWPTDGSRFPTRIGRTVVRLAATTRGAGPSTAADRSPATAAIAVS